MTATYEQIEDEAHRRFDENPCTPLAHYIIEVVREGWKPPEPVDPDLLVVREVVAVEWEKWCAEHEEDAHYGAERARSGRCDSDHSVRAALAAYKAGKAAR